jgi:hypothetical protein
MDKTKTISDLKKTKEVLNTLGWRQGMFQGPMEGNRFIPDRSGPCCLIGAYNLATVGDACGYSDGATDEYAANLLGFEEASQAFNWNDEGKRTKEEVLDRIDAAIARLENS